MLAGASGSREPIIGRLAAVVLAAVVVTSVVAVPAVGATGTDRAGDSSSIPTQDPSRASIDDELRRQSGVVDVVVRLAEPDLSTVRPGEAAIRRLTEHAARTQRPVRRFAARRDGVEMQKGFWLTNAVLLRVDKSEVELRELARIEGVTRLHRNYRVTVPEPERSGDDPRNRSIRSNGYNTTYGLAQINATAVWDEYGVRGEGVKVAVLDTGVNVSHPDIDLYTDDASDPTYPGGWAEFNSTGHRVEGSVPHDTHGHGTHTSGTVSGGNASGEWIGVAPNVELMHGLTVPSGYGTYTQTIAGMEWAVNNSADVISMSLGFDNDVGQSEWIDAVRNAQAAGTLVVVSAGNSGEGTIGTPGSVYESITVGASNDSAGITYFSSGKVINASDFWGTNAPAEWPDEYVVPDVAAPGAAVKSALPDGGYDYWDGTSMAAPHVAGTLALMQSAAGGDLDPGTAKQALYSTAWKPPGEPGGNDTRYGTGIVDAKNATDLVAVDSGINGTVTDPNGTAVAGATVAVEDGFRTTTDANGTYSIIATNGTHNVTVDAFGFAPTTETVTVPNGSYVVRNVTLQPVLEVRQTGSQRADVESGDSVTVTFEAANVANVTVDLTGTYDQANASLTVNGNNGTFGNPVELGGYTGTVTVTVTTAANTSGNVSLTHTFRGTNGTSLFSTGTTVVVERYTEVGVLDTPNGEWGDDVVAVLDGNLPVEYNVTRTTNATVLDELGGYDAVVVQRLPANQSFVSTFRNETSTDEVGVVYLDQWGSESNAITALSAATGDPNSTGTAYDNEVPQFVLDEHHILFDDVGGAGDAVPIHDRSYGDHSWYTGFHGDDLADVDNGTAVVGRGIGVDRANRTVLLASLGRQTYATNADYTAAADRILRNAVEYAANRSFGAVVKPPTGVGEANATLRARVPSLDRADAAEVTVEYWRQGNPGNASTAGNTTCTSACTFSTAVSGLQANTTYVVRATATRNDTGEVDQSATLTFRTDRGGDVTGVVQKHDGSPVEGRYVWAVAYHNDSLLHVSAPDYTDGNGTFAIEDLRMNATYTVTGYDDAANGSAAPNGVPDAYNVANVTVGDETELGTTNLSNPHVLNVTVVNESGAPVENATVRVYPSHRKPNPAIVFRTQPDGKIDYGSDGTRGVEVAGEVRLVVEPPANDPRFNDTTYTRTINVTGDGNETFTLQESCKTVYDAIDDDGDGYVGDFEVLAAIEYWRDDAAVPDTCGATIGDFQVLELIEMWRDDVPI